MPRAPWLGAALLFTPLTALAEEEAKPYPECTKEPSDSDVTAAKAAFQAGNVSFNEADYPRAILYWEDAYRRDCTKHQMLLNLARAYELNGNKKQAVMALETFLVREPNAPDKPQITRRVEVLKKQIESEPAAASPQPAATEPASQAPASSEPAAAATAESPPPDEQGKRPIAPLIVAGVGGAMLLGGTVLYVIAANQVDEYASHCEDPENRRFCPRDEVDDANAARTRQNVSGVVAIAGGALVAGGLIWYFVSPREPASGALTRPRTAVVPSVGPGFAGVSLSGAF